MRLHCVIIKHRDNYRLFYLTGFRYCLEVYLVFPTRLPGVPFRLTCDLLQVIDSVLKREAHENKR
jgi:hypothetical protein